MVQDVAVLGSLNLDVVFACVSHPKPGETILCDRVKKGPGGKGLNQAVAASCAGADTILYGAIGSDSEGQHLLDILASRGVSTKGVCSIEDAQSGIAHIVVDAAGENSIIVASGANRAPQLDPGLFAVADAAVFLAQCEMDVALITAFFRIAAENKAVRIFNAAPALDSARPLFAECDILIVNEHELAFFAGGAIEAADEDALAQAARSIMGETLRSVIVTLGSAGVLVVTRDFSQRFAAENVSAVDTTGAGDCFCGVFAASIARGMDQAAAIERAIRASGLCVTRKGAALAMPIASEFDV